jgi:diguanylate cyclase (GGDEF)-like protein
MKPSFLLRLADGLLGTEPKQRLRTGNALLALAVYVAFAFVQHGEVLLGLIDEAASWPLTAWNLGGGLLFVLLVRSGLGLQLARKGDPGLSIPQMLWAIVGICWSYGITGPARGAVILILLPVLIYGIFSLNARQSRKLTAVAFGMLAAVMVFKAVTDPARYEPRVELMHLLFAAIVMASVSALAIRVGAMRERLQRQRGELAEALEHIQVLATHDELTGLTNRRAATARMREELALRTRQLSGAQPLLSVVLIDIDHFKRVNDELGHAAGDEVLRRFAAAGQSVLRTGELLARWGGEEFLLVMPAADGQQALAAAMRLREQLRRHDFSDLRPGLVISFSAGVAECAPGDELDAAVARADAALYEAKRAGRDRVLLARSGPVPVAAAG